MKWMICARGTAERMRRHAYTAGFTLLEMLAALAVIAILAGLLVAVIGPIREKARRAETAQFIQAIEIAVKDFQLACHRYPWPDPEPGVPWNLTEERRLPDAAVFRALAPQYPSIRAADVDDAGAGLNPDGRNFLVVPPRFLAENGAVVDAWGRPLLLHWDSESRELAVISCGPNGINESLTPDGGWLPKPYGDDVNNR